MTDICLYDKMNTDGNNPYNKKRDILDFGMLSIFSIQNIWLVENTVSLVDSVFSFKISPYFWELELCKTQSLQKQ